MEQVTVTRAKSISCAMHRIAKASRRVFIRSTQAFRIFIEETGRGGCIKGFRMGRRFHIGSRRKQ